MNFSELRNLELENICEWPMVAKIFFGVIAFGVIFGLGYQFDLKAQNASLYRYKDQEVKLRQEFEQKQKKASNLPALISQLDDIKETFGDLLKRLPDKTEVAELLIDISQQGLAAGLEFELFKPGQEKPNEFYVELPIEIRVIGNYHEFGEFISGISGLPRIVTTHDVKLLPTTEGLLTMQTIAKTYRYIEEGNVAD